MNDASVNYFWCLITSRLGRSACVNCVSNIRTRSSATADGPRDAACQSKSQLLHNCRNKLYKSRTSEVIGLEYYVWTTCSKQPRHVDRRRCGQQARPSTSFVDDLIDLPWQNFWVRDKVPQKSLPYFGDTRISLQVLSYGDVHSVITQCTPPWDRSKVAPVPKISSIRSGVLIELPTFDRRTT